MALTQGWLLDTHCWLWLRNGTLGVRQQDLDLFRHIADEGNWFVCSFSMFEIAHAVSRKRLHLDRPMLRWFKDALRHPGPRLLEITPQIADATFRLPDSFQGDPGDRILAATAVVHNLTICTHDDLLLRFGKQGLFRVLKVNEKKEKHVH